MPASPVRGGYKLLSLIAALALLATQANPTPTNAATRAQPACGAWSIVPTSGTALDLGRFKDVAATSHSNVWAIGSTSDQNDLLARWDGTGWSLEPHPQPGSFFNDFQGIATSSEGDAWIVGAYSSSRASRPSMAETSTLTQRLQGGRWKLVPSPNHPNKPQSYLNSIAPIGPDDVWAVGNAGGEDIVLRWNGTEWAFTPVPIAAQGGYLFDVAGTSPGDVWAVGVYTTDKFTQAARILHWNGADWQLMPNPDLPSAEYNLQGVAALTQDDAWAVGTRTENGRTLTLIEHWDGSAWTVVPSPNTTRTENTLHRVTATAPDDVWAVGRAGTGGDAQPLMLHFDGTAWANVTLPRINARFSELVSVSTVPGSTEIWAVGAYADANSREHTLAMRYRPCADGGGTPGEGVPGGGIPGMPATGAEGNPPLAAQAVATLLHDSVAALLALIRQLPGLF